jgi:3-hydroxybutyryl-CoA dehydratase
MNDPARELRYEDIAVGDTAEFEVTVTRVLVDEFAALSGDQNPLHVDEGYAARTVFGQRVAHGMIAGALYSRLIGMYLPGKYSLYLSQTIQFHKPIFIGTKVVVRGEVTHKTDVHAAVTISLVVEEAGSKKKFVSGEAVVRVLK